MICLTFVFQNFMYLFVTYTGNVSIFMYLFVTYTGNVSISFLSPLSLSVLVLLGIFLPGSMCACYNVFTCLWSCIHELCDIVRLGTGDKCKCTFINERSCELLPNQHIWPLCYSQFLHVMIQCTLGVVWVCCNDWNIKLFTYFLLYYCCAWRSNCQNSDVLIERSQSFCLDFWRVDNFVFMYCGIWTALQYCL